MIASLSSNKLNLPDQLIKFFPTGFGPARLGRSPIMYKWLLTQAQKNQPTIIHSHSMWMMPNVYAGWVSKKTEAPLLVSPRGTFDKWAFSYGSHVKKLFWPLVQKPALSSVSCFHATAISEYEDIRRMGFRQPVAVIPNGIDMPPLLNKVIAPMRTLIFVSRIHPKKGIETLLYAWAALNTKFPDWKLRIVGPDNGGHLYDMQKLAAKLNLNRVEFTGPLYGNDKWQAYRNADLFVLPTYSENFGLAVAEALATGIPVIVTKGAPWKGLEHNGAGWWINIGLDSLVSTLEEALDCSPATLQEMGECGKSWMRRDYTWRDLGAQMVNTYSWLLGNSPKPKYVFED
jgi:glycosyltransferase involved in cell wall biosynthesis